MPGRVQGERRGCCANSFYVKVDYLRGSRLSGDFVGRKRELAVLQKRFVQVAVAGAGTALAVHGRRQVGKSRLAQEFCDRTAAPYLFWAASKGAAPAVAVDEFVYELRKSTLIADAAAVPTVKTGSWPDAWRALATALPDRASIVVLDELPWAAEQDPGFDGALQTVWDRYLSAKPVLLLLLGSDVHMMERLTSYDRPFYGCAGVLPLDPLNPAEVSDALELSGAAALEAHAACGGLPGILRSWPRGVHALDFMQAECEDPSTALFNVPQQALSAEFPAPDHTRRALEAIGSGERTHANIAAAAGGASGGLPSGALSPILRRLADEKRVIVAEAPLSTRPGKPALRSHRRQQPEAVLGTAAACLPRGAEGTLETGVRADSAGLAVVVGQGGGADGASSAGAGSWRRRAALGRRRGGGRMVESQIRPGGGLGRRRPLPSGAEGAFRRFEQVVAHAVRRP